MLKFLFKIQANPLALVKFVSWHLILALFLPIPSLFVSSKLAYAQNIQKILVVSDESVTTYGEAVTWGLKAGIKALQIENKFSVEFTSFDFLDPLSITFLTREISSLKPVAIVAVMTEACEKVGKVTRGWSPVIFGIVCWNLSEELKSSVFRLDFNSYEEMLGNLIHVLTTKFENQRFTVLTGIHPIFMPISKAFVFVLNEQSNIKRPIKFVILNPDQALTRARFFRIISRLATESDVLVCGLSKTLCLLSAKYLNSKKYPVKVFLPVSTALLARRELTDFQHMVYFPIHKIEISETFTKFSDTFQKLTKTRPNLGFYPHLGFESVLILNQATNFCGGGSKHECIKSKLTEVSFKSMFGDLKFNADGSRVPQMGFDIKSTF
ncbi:MAG: hypothetical protein NZO16_07700 [Deltaproteobacteria bacterium]|nr:hypothetical protein [Deltaproteobacteria bacterium]